MSLCSLNISIGVFENETGNYFIVKRKKLEGVYGKYLDRFLAGSSERNCIFRPVTDFGVRLNNGSFTGARKLVLERKIDYIARLDHLLVYDDFLVATTPCTAEPFTLGMFLKPPASRNENALSFLEHSTLILNFIFVGLLITSLCIFALLLLDQQQQRPKGQGRPNAFRRSLRALIAYYQSLARRSYSPSKVNCILVTFLLFTMILNNTLTSNINTNRVILNTSELIDSRSKLESTQRWACWLGVDSAANDLMMQSGKTNDLTRILDRKRRPPNNTVCILHTTSPDFFEMPIGEMFYVLLRSSLHIFMSFFCRVVESRHDNRFTFFEDDQLLDYELIRVQYVAAELEERLKDRLLLKVSQYFEFGNFIQLYGKFEAEAMKGIGRGNLHTSVQDFAGKYTKTRQIRLSYFVNLLKAWSIVNAGLLLLFLLRHLRLRLARNLSLQMKRHEFKVHRFNLFFSYPTCRATRSEEVSS